MLFLSPWQRMLKKMGFLNDQKGILVRYRNERKAWESHLENTKKFIRESIQNMPHSKVAVLGSGWLLDLPIEDLMRHFSEIHLFDVNHPRSVRSQYKKYKNISFIEADISGGAISETYRMVNEYKKNKKIILPDELNILGFQDADHYDCVISLNILNQLDILALDYLVPLKIYSDDQIILLRKIIQQKHIDSLPPNKTIGIADYEEIWLSKYGVEMGRKNSLYCTLPDTISINRWQWNFDNHFNYYLDKNVRFNVMAFVL